MIVRFLMILLAIFIAASLFFYVLTGREIFLNRAWHLIGVGFVFFLMIWFLLGLENIT